MSLQNQPPKPTFDLDAAIARDLVSYASTDEKDAYRKGAEYGKREALACVDEQFFINVIEEWKAVWMNQTQNSKDDFENYFRRAMGVDANMKHSLAKMIARAFEKLSGGGGT